LERSVFWQGATIRRNLEGAYILKRAGRYQHAVANAEKSWSKLITSSNAAPAS